jgi:hypothetical protein
MSTHPSYLALDSYALGAADAADAAHLESCPRCKSHLARLEPSPVPEWVRSLETNRRRRWLPWLRWPHLAALCAALIAGAFVLPRALKRPEHAMKGGPSVAIYVKHGAALSLWDGRALLSPGDGLQLKVAPAGFSRVTVASVGASDPVEMYAGPIDAQRETTLPRSWTLDADPAPDVLLIVFSRAPLSLDDLRTARDALPRSAQLWSTRLELVKHTERR